jgi:hypothetical protein
MESSVSCHATDETLERYAMGRLAGPYLEQFETHLLMCAYCQEALTFTETYLESIRSASQALRRASSSTVQPWYQKLLLRPTPAWCLGLSACAILIIAGDQWRSLHPSPEALPTIMLESTRGAEVQATSSMPARKPFVLMLDMTDLQPLPQCKLEIVDALGQPVFEARQLSARNTLSAAITTGLPAGVYYIRLYTPSSELLREYGLKIAD